MGPLARLLLWVALWGLAGCWPSSASRAAPSARLLFSSQECGTQATVPAARWIADAGGVERLFEGVERRTLGGERKARPEVDFEGERVLLVERGPSANSGYGLELFEPEVEVEGGAATLKVAWIDPSPDRLYAQMVTSPCILVALPALGFDRVRVVDQEGRLRFVVPVGP